MECSSLHINGVSKGGPTVVGDASFIVSFESGDSARAVRIRHDLRTDLATIGLTRSRPVLVLVGGASGMDDTVAASLQAVLAEAVLPVLAGNDVVVIDGGTDAGVMRMIGRARAVAGADFPLVGVAAEGTVALPGDGTASADAAPLERHHSHFVLVPGGKWGDESPWLARTATAIAERSPSATMLINGGQISFQDVERSLADRRPVMVLDGTGRTADRIAAACRGDRGDEQAMAVADSPHLFVVPMTHPDGIRTRLQTLLSGQ
jgi:hypothetical protein